jgi:hypothetical protein
MPAPGQPLTARDVILEIVHNMREGVEPMLYASLAPAVYYVHLHPDDFERLSPVAPRLVEEARRALDEELARQNASGRFTPGPLRRWLGRPPAVERPQDGWTIHLQPDPDEELLPGHLAVTSELSLPPRQQFEGTETRRVTTTQRGTQTDTRRQTVATAVGSAPVAVATLTYTDDAGPHTYVMEKDRIVVGRGGIGYWVDVRLQAPPDVSREHLRIRRDAATGGFFVKDLSSLGTTLGAAALPRSIEVVGDAKRDLDVEVPLPDRARLVLAGLVTIDFERRGGGR